MAETTTNKVATSNFDNSDDSTINLMKWERVKRLLSGGGGDKKKDVVRVSTSDVFRITKMAYKNNYLIIFLTGYVQANPNRVFQCYVETKCDLYSYQFCYNNHFFSKCKNSCKSYKAFVMPGVRNVHMDKFNVMKYKCEANSNARSFDKWKKKPLDYFLRDVNRVHMQTNLKEGQYVQFARQQTFVNRRLVGGNACDTDAHKNLFKITPVEELSRKIMPVVVCYDIETHSNGQKFSNALENHIMSISMVMRRDNVDTKLCLYYLANNDADDVPDDEGADARSATLAGRVTAIRFATEMEMLSAFFELLPLLNADYVLDYNGDKFDLPFILDRVKHLNAARGHGAASKRVKPNTAPADCVPKIRRYDLQPVDIETQVLHDKFGNKLNSHLFTYYVHVDLYQFLSTDSEHKNLENYQLNTVADHYLKKTKVDLSIVEMLNLYNSNRVKKMIEYNIQDSVLPIDLLLKLEIMDFLYTQCMLLYLCTDDLLSNISHKISVVFFNLCLTNTVTTADGSETPDPYIFNKNDLSITSGRRNNKTDDNGNDKHGAVDLTLLKRTPVPSAAIPPDAIKLCSTRPVCNYKGGKVLSPQSGFKKWVVTFDFNSLYPTIMMYEGVCFSNLFVADDNFVYLHNNMDATNPKLLRNLMKLRQKYKSMRDTHPVGSFLYGLYDTLQNAVKRIANSIYGYFGIYFKVLANYVTKMGRTKLIEAVKRIESMSDDADIKKDYNLSKINFKVIYGDTDSSFIQVDFNENEIEPHLRFATITNIVQNEVLVRLNASWHGKGYKMALENVMSSLILLKKKKYCYLNSEGRIKYKGWLIKKDMPLFMRKTFRAVVDSFLLGHSVACGLELMHATMIQYYNDFGKERDHMINYSFSMSYNENSTTANKNKKAESTRKPVITIAKHCRELLLQSGVKSLPGNGDRIPFLLVDIKSKITQKSYPLALFDPQNSAVRVSWIKHMNILCNFMNELIQVFGDSMPEFQYYFGKICFVYMSEQTYDVKYPALAAAKLSSSSSAAAAKKASESEDDSGTDLERDDDYVNCALRQFKMYVRKPPNVSYVKQTCTVCNKIC
ncbi:DNA polymerase [Orgyia pseudotsugata single capsid nuclopolyhedrovirus]|nr:DNA polymerase [Orgyia pseudotsugata single capsid nuclopolyhedrovirus]